MKSQRHFLPWIFVILLWAGFASYVWLSSAQLPDRVATHFGVAGQPNGWMSRQTHVEFTIAAGAVVPGFILGLFALIGRLGGRGLNLPHKDYWLAPERREATFAFIRRQGLWFAGLFILFFAGIHTSILAANAHAPVHLSNASVGWVSGSFLVASAIWVAAFFIRFLHRPA